jgi:hypothetical protein
MKGLFGVARTHPLASKGRFVEPGTQSACHMPSPGQGRPTEPQCPLLAGRRAWGRSRIPAPPPGSPVRGPGPGSTPPAARNQI